MRGAGATCRSGRVSVLERLTDAPRVGWRVGSWAEEVNGRGMSSYFDDLDGIVDMG